MKIGIAGAGLIGRLIAWQRARVGDSVTLYEQDQGGAHSSAAWVAAAMLAPWSEAVAGERAVLAPAIQSLGMWPELLDRLRDDAGAAPSLTTSGTLAVAHRSDAALLSEFEARLQRLPSVPDIQLHDRTALANAEPVLAASFERGLYLPEESGLDNRELLASLEIALKDKVSWRRGEVVRQVDSHCITTGVGSDNFDVVIDCRGFGAKSALSDLRGVRGEILWVRAPEVSLHHTLRLMHPRYQLYISPRADHVFVVGATQIESESEAPVTVRSNLELLSALYSVSTGFAEGYVLESHARCRPAFPDNMPRVDVSSGKVSVNGLFRHGFLLAPWVLEKAMAAIEVAVGVDTATTVAV